MRSTPAPPLLHRKTQGDDAERIRSVGNVTLTVAKTSEYQIAASITVDLINTDVQTDQDMALVELPWTGFLTIPQIAPT